jgi:uncharacterized protein YcnI
MKRFALLTVVLAVLGAGPAWAHEEINPSTIAVNRPAFLTITAANEKKVKLTKLTVTAPTGVAMGEATRDPAGWTSSRTATAVTWTGGSVDPARFESFGFELEEAEQPGTLAYKATLGYADGTSEDATVQVSATATAALASSGSGAADSGSDDSGDGRANLALGLGAAAVALSVAALALGRRRPGTSPAAGATGGEQDW